MSGRERPILERQADAEKHEIFGEMPEGATEALEQAIEPPDNRFVPMYAEQLLDALCMDPVVRASGDELRRVFDALREVIDQEGRRFERRLLRTYFPFWPDADTVVPEGKDGAREEAFLRSAAYLMEKANYERLTDEQLEHAIRTANTHGLRVEIDNSLVRHLEVYARGRGTIEKRFRSARAPVRGRAREIDVFRRLAIVLSFHEDERIVLKLFRDIPLADLEALMPHAKVRMGWFDRLKVFGGGFGAMGGLASKLWTVIIGGAAATSGLLWAGIAALFGVSVKSFLGYRSTMRHRMGQRTQHLYYQNLANNAGVITALVHHVCEEELKEAILAYAFLLDHETTTPEELDARVEEWIERRYGLRINFDCPDALETLDRVHLWDDRDAWTVVRPDEAVARLEHHWCEKRSSDYHERALSRVS